MQRIGRRCLSLSVARRGDASESGYHGRDDWRYTPTEDELYKMSQKEYLDKLKDPKGWLAEIQAGSKANAEEYEKRRKATRYSLFPLIKQPRPWQTENIYEANYFWPKICKWQAKRFEQQNIKHMRMEDADALKYHMYVMYAMLAYALVVEMPEIMIYVWKENRA